MITKDSLQSLTPSQIDKLWDEAMRPAYEAQRELVTTRRSIKRYGKFGMDVPEYLTERAATQQAKLEEAMKASEPFDAEYERRQGWTRYLVVVGSTGHVHRMYHGSRAMVSTCHTLIPGQTLVAPMWALSGRDDDGVIAAIGSKACTKCFKDAPVAPRQSAEAQGYCPGSDMPAENISWRYRSPRGKCAHCHEWVTVTKSGRPRKHAEKK